MKQHYAEVDASVFPNDTKQSAERDTLRRLRSIFSGSVGNLVEWYDWYVYSAFATYFAKAFFPKGDQTAQLLNVAALTVVSGYTSINAVVKAGLFPAEIRALGVGLPYAITVSIFGGTAEYIALWL